MVPLNLLVETPVNLSILKSDLNLEVDVTDIQTHPSFLVGTHGINLSPTLLRSQVHKLENLVTTIPHISRKMDFPTMCPHMTAGVFSVSCLLLYGLYNIKRLDSTVVMIWCYINNEFELNQI